MAKKALAALLFLLVLLALGLVGCGDGKRTYSGYLIDQKCGAAGKCESSDANLITHPEKHTLQCLLMPDCVVSGYGIAIKQDGGNYRFVPFDSKGSALALNNIVYKTKQANGILVDVVGKMEKNRLAVESVVEK